MAEDFDKLRERALGEARSAVTRAYAEEDHALIQAINSYLELSKSQNLINQRLTEWFGVYFPEVRIVSQKAIAELAILFAKHEGKEPSEEELEGIFDEKGYAKIIIEKMRTTQARRGEEKERQALGSFAVTIKSTYETMELLDKYIDEAAKRVMPNVTFLTESKIAAELLSKAGSMEKLANMPASTIQLLGAEKALFKHIKFGSKPPKYGVLFKFPIINNARGDLRGRIARAYAAKIAIALKADHYSKNFIAEKLKEKLDETVKKISAMPERPRPKWSPAGGRGGRPGNQWQRGGRRDNYPRGGGGGGMRRKQWKRPNIGGS